jgi:hypothetical protein
MHGGYIPLHNGLSPIYIFSSNTYLNSPDHFFINIVLQFPNRKPVNTFALIDSGASASCISDRFALRHSLPRSLKEIPVPITAVDNRPIAGGLVTHDVLCQLEVNAHAETIKLGVVSVGYPVILGLDWLRKHNPAINWSEMSLSLDCCGLTRSQPVRTVAQGFGLPRPIPVTSLNSSSVTAIGLGLGLAGTSLSLNVHTPDSSRSPGKSTPIKTSEQLAIASDTAHKKEKFLLPSPLTHSPSFSSQIAGLNGFGRAIISSSLSLPSPIPRIKTMDAKSFAKYSRTEQISLIRFHPIDSPGYRIATFTSTTNTQSLAADLDHNPPTPFLPTKYAPWATTVFSETELDRLPPHRPYDISIDLEEGKTPPFGPMYRLSLDEREALAKYIDENLKKGFIRRSTSSAASPILFVRKKTGELRLCVDYRGLNAITKKNRYPLPLIDDLLDRTQGCKFFTAIDLKNAFNLIRVKEGDEWKTAFRTPLGLFETLVMPFGLTNAPSTFQAFIQDTLRDYLDIFCVVYLDDILIFSRSQTEHDEHVKKVLDRLQSARLFANPNKCVFDAQEIDYLGYVIGAEGIRMSPKKLDTIRDWPEPRSVKDVQSFLGFANFYRRFVHRYSQIAVPLTSLCKKDTPFIFNEQARSAFTQLKHALLSYPTLHHFNPKLPCTLATDASDFALAAVLMQPDNSGSLHPVAYYSRKFTPAEINYEVYDKELLAVIEAFRDMRAWLLGASHPISVISDHKNLEYFMSTRVLNRRQARWAMFLSEFDFKLTWGPGIKNVADSPSRRPDFIPQKGDNTLEAQYRTLLKPYHTDSLFPTETLFPTPKTTISALTTLTVDNSDLLKRFKSAFQEDQEWREALA